MRNFLRQNIYIYDKIKTFKYRKSNNWLNRCIEEISKIDSISYYNEFKKTVVRMKAYAYENGISLAGNNLGQESTYYGHMMLLDRFANRIYQDSERLLLPCIEHGITWYERPPEAFGIECIHNYVFQGKYKERIVHNRKPLTPVYCIGPYINYAKTIYSDKDMSQRNNQNGKTALVFPFHCYEKSTAEYDTRKFVEALLSAVKNYDTILVSAYWNDVDDPIYEMFESEGAVIVSSGFRGDYNFMDRQRTLIELSDATYGNGLGTHIGYSLFLNRPHYMIPSKIELQEKVKNLNSKQINIYSQIEKTFYNAFSICDEYENKEEDRTNLYKEYWGGSSLVKSREEIRAMFEISEDILNISQGNSHKYEDSIQRLLSRYEKNSHIKYNVLSGAVSN